MIQNNVSIQDMLNNIIEQATIIRNDFNSNGQTHCVYILEKLNRAKWDLDILIQMANDRKEKLKDEIN